MIVSPTSTNIGDTSSVSASISVSDRVRSRSTPRSARRMSLRSIISVNASQPVASRTATSASSWTTTSTGSTRTVSPTMSADNPNQPVCTSRRAATSTRRQTSPKSHRPSSPGADFSSPPETGSVASRPESGVTRHFDVFPPLTSGVPRSYVLNRNILAHSSTSSSIKSLVYGSALNSWATAAYRAWSLRSSTSAGTAPDSASKHRRKLSQSTRMSEHFPTASTSCRSGCL
mmetsp:Transcript_14324/g.58330  ORF Transcript_14324/g.58330 Transcript_14324/m.58330 type:complete len:231 (+) Transcript_14324:3674-4366(+)